MAWKARAFALFAFALGAGGCSTTSSTVGGGPAGSEVGPEGEGGVDGGDGEPVPPDGGTRPTPSTRFATTPTRWAVPPIEHPGGVFALGYGSEYYGYWTTTDLDGDGKPELVVTSPEKQAVFADGAGPYWKVYKATASGFASTHARWSVPAIQHPGGVFALGYGSEYYGYWTTTDLDGDGRPDLVVTSPEKQKAFTDGAGASWKVYRAE